MRRALSAPGEVSSPAAAPDRPEGRLPYSASGVSSRAAVPGRPKQGPALSEGRLPYSASGVSS